jgi:glycosyltransferase involved in cell wall biosynthesis
MRIAVDYRILVVGPSSIHRGMGRFTQQQLREVLRVDPDNEYVLVCYADSDTSLVLPEIAAAPNVEVRRLPPGTRLTGVDGEAASALRRASEFQEWIHRLGVDLFHATTPFLLEGPILSDFDACPMVATFYDVIPLVFPAQYLTNGPAREYYMRTLGLLDRATRLQSISECSRGDAAYYLGFPAARNDLVYPIADPCFSVMEPEGVERRLRRLRAVHGISGGYVLAVSDIHHAKNVETLLQSFALVPSALRAGLPLVISCHLSDGSMAYVRAMADRLGVADDVVLTGVVADVELASLYNAATMVVHPSKYEGFGLPVLEAMSCGAPVITTSSSSLPEVAGGAALLVDPEDVWGFSDAIQELHGDPGRRLKMAEQGLERAAFFTGDGLARATLASYGAAARGDGLPPARVRVALWTPLPPQRSGIADYSVELLGALETTHDVEVFVDDGFLPDANLLRDHRVQHFGAFARRHGQAPFDAIVYQMGGSTYHLYMYDPLQVVPGIVVLHDLMWSHVLLTECNERDDLDGFKRELLALEGPDALAELLAIEERNGAEPAAAHDSLWTFLSDHPMLGRVIDASVAQIVHFDSARVELEQRYAASRVRTIPMGVRDPVRPGRPLEGAETRARLGLEPSTFVVGVFGIVHPVKRVESCVQALGRLVAEHPDSVLLVVGEALDSAYVEGLTSLAAELGVLPHARFAGYVPRFEFDAQLLCCDVVVNLRAPLTKHMSATLLRGLAAGRPMIVSALADWDFLPDDACLQVPPGEDEVDVLAGHLADLAADPARRLAMSAAARRYFRREASIERMAARYRDVIAEVTAGTPA